MSSASWTEIRVTSFIGLCLDEVKKNGLATDNCGFKSQSWTSILDAFNQENMVMYTKVLVMSKFSELKKKFKIFQALKDNSGFGFDDVTKLPSAHDQVWKDYIDKHPESALFRYKTLPCYDELEQLFNGKIATGAFATSSTSFASTPPSTASLKQLSRTLFTPKKRCMP